MSVKDQSIYDSTHKLNIRSSGKENIMFQKEDNVNIFRVAEWKNGEMKQQIFTPITSAHNCYSVSKCFTTTAIGMLVDRNKMSDEDTIDNFFDLSKYDSNFKNVQVKHLLNQTMGIEYGFMFEGDLDQVDTYDWLDYIFRQPLSYAPDEHFAYSNSTYYLLSRIVEKVSGQDLSVFLEENLMRQLGIRGWAWQRCPYGYSFGATGMYAATTDLISFGRMYKDYGQYNGQQLVSREWATKATTKNSPDICETYNYGFRILEDGTITCVGAHGQNIVISRDKDIVVANHACEDNVDVCKIMVDYVASL